ARRDRHEGFHQHHWRWSRSRKGRSLPCRTGQVEHSPDADREAGDRETRLANARPPMGDEDGEDADGAQRAEHAPGEARRLIEWEEPVRRSIHLLLLR